MIISHFARTMVLVVPLALGNTLGCKSSKQADSAAKNQFLENFEKQSRYVPESDGMIDLATGLLVDGLGAGSALVGFRLLGKIHLNDDWAKIIPIQTTELKTATAPYSQAKKAFGEADSTLRSTRQSLARARDGYYRIYTTQQLVGYQKVGNVQIPQYRPIQHQTWIPPNPQKVQQLQPQIAPLEKVKVTAEADLRKHTPRYERALGQFNSAKNSVLTKGTKLDGTTVNKKALRNLKVKLKVLKVARYMMITISIAAAFDFASRAYVVFSGRRPSVAPPAIELYKTYREEAASHKADEEEIVAAIDDLSAKSDDPEFQGMLNDVRRIVEEAN